MPNEIGLELEEPNAPSQDRTKGAFAKFFADPKNIATALVFGASLAQPRQAGHDGLATLMQRATGAAAFRGQLQAGVEGQKLKREQTAFERAQVEREAGQRERQLDISQQGVDNQETQLAMDQSQFERKMQQDERLAGLDRRLRESLAGMGSEPTDADWAKIAMDSVPYLLETMQFEEGTTPVQKMQMAQIQAWRGVELYRNMLRTNSKTVMQDGQIMIDDGKGGVTPAVTGAATPAPTPAPANLGTPTPSGAPVTRTQQAEQRLSGMQAQQGREIFAPTLMDRFRTSAAKGDVAAARAQEQGLAPARQRAALRLKRAMRIGAQFNRYDVQTLQEADDATLSQWLSPQEIVGLRRMAGQL